MSIRLTLRWATCLSAFFVVPCVAAAATIVYDPSTGLLPNQTGWTYYATGNQAPSVSVSGGVLSMTAGFTDRAGWRGDLLQAGNSAGTDLFIESTVRVLAEGHLGTGRGIEIFSLTRTTGGAGGTENEIDGYAWTDRIFWMNTDDQKVGEYLLDTTAYHTYRLEVEGDNDYIYVDGRLVGAVLNNSYSDPNDTAGSRASFGDFSAYSWSSTQWKTVTAGALQDSISQSNPVLPAPPAGTGADQSGVYVFNNVPSGRWFDPPFADGFTYTMTSGNLFTSIGGFPTGFNGPFTITADGHTWVGSPGHPVDFESLPEHGVSSFTVSGISPVVDAANSSAFPLLLNFDSPNASFTMTAHTVPEPGALLVWSLIAGIFGIAGVRKRLE